MGAPARAASAGGIKIYSPSTTLWAAPLRLVCIVPEASDCWSLLHPLAELQSDLLLQLDLVPQPDLPLQLLQSDFPLHFLSDWGEPSFVHFDMATSLFCGSDWAERQKPANKPIAANFTKSFFIKSSFKLWVLKTPFEATLNSNKIFVHWFQDFWQNFSWNSPKGARSKIFTWIVNKILLRSIAFGALKWSSPLSVHFPSSYLPSHPLLPTRSFINSPANIF